MLGLFPLLLLIAELSTWWNFVGLLFLMGFYSLIGTFVADRYCAFALLIVDNLLFASPDGIFLWARLI